MTKCAIVSGADENEGRDVESIRAISKAAAEAFHNNLVHRDPASTKSRGTFVLDPDFLRIALKIPQSAQTQKALKALLLQAKSAPNKELYIDANFIMAKLCV